MSTYKPPRIMSETQECEDRCKFWLREALSHLKQARAEANSAGYGNVWMAGLQEAINAAEAALMELP